MSEFVAETAVLAKIVELALANATVTAQVSDRVWDEPRDDDNINDTDYPYIHLEAMNSRRTEIGCGNSINIRMRWFAVSGNEFGRLLAWKLADDFVKAVCVDLDDVPTLVEGYRLLSDIRHVQSSSVIDPDAVKAVAIDIECDVSRTARQQEDED